MAQNKNCLPVRQPVYYELYVPHEDDNSSCRSSAHHILEAGQAIMAGKGGSAVGLTEILNADGVPEAMRSALRIGTTKIMQRLTKAIEEARADGSPAVEGDALFLAETLYELWMGASLLEKITRNDEPLKTAMAATRHIFNISPAQ